MGYALPPLAGLDKEKTHPYTTKGGAPAKAKAKARLRDPQGNVKSTAKRPRKGNCQIKRDSSLALRTTVKSAYQYQEKDPSLKNARVGHPQKIKKVTATQDDCERKKGHPLGTENASPAVKNAKSTQAGVPRFLDKRR